MYIHHMWSICTCTSTMHHVPQLWSFVPLISSEIIALYAAERFSDGATPTYREKYPDGRFAWVELSPLYLGVVVGEEVVVLCFVDEVATLEALLNVRIGLNAVFEEIERQ